MGLFGGKSKQQEAVEDMVMQKLSQVPLLDMIIETLKNEKEPWMEIAQSYYDNRQRVVVIEDDGFQIKWRTVRREDYIGNDGKRHSQNIEDVHERVGYSYTKSGYLPLHGYRNERGYEEVNVGRMRYLWASIIRERLVAQMPECQFGEVKQGDGIAYFIYTVPALIFKDWF